MDETFAGLTTGARTPSGDEFLRLEFAPRETKDLGAELGAERAPTTRHRALRNTLLATLLLTAWNDPERWLVYSRDRNSYAVLRRYHGPIVSYDRMMWAIESLESSSLIEHRRTWPSPSARFGSTIRATQKALESSPITNVRQLAPLETELVKLKNSAKQLQAYEDTEFTRSLRLDIRDQNRALSKVTISFTSNEWQTDTSGLLHSGTRTINLAKFKLYRVFNRDWGHGGRWYGAWWQNISANERKLIRMDGEPVHEIDFNHLHPTLLSALTGQELAEGDPYIIDGFPRGHCKKAFNILLNANTEKSAVGALQLQLSNSGIESPGQYAKTIVTAVKERHPSFSGLWGTGFGLRLQFVDACICSRVQKQMRGLSSPVLSVHDSFLIAQSRKETLQQAMSEALDLAMHQLANNGMLNFSDEGLHNFQKNLTSGAVANPSVSVA